ncbi:hypothetical protein [Erythrobacter sp. JK5]|uniref:hypothetical protein n=1 Tax=Erythrobacter sp. JK5 TaxID=2829500 RepID=UPI001BADB81F|nr:hypothetical protein [Erythrobacter sp. JK5]QUL36860.1 hypothetical protein KDC96_10600 [Erythrobacter sp. JK5]
MRAFPLAAAAVIAFASPVYAQADEQPVEPPEAALSELSDRLGDPQFQDQAAVMAQVFVSAMLDLEVGPFADAIDRATGGAGPDIDPDARVRDLAPEAEDLPERLSESLPVAMNAMSAMTEGMRDMLPAFRDMAERMREAIEEARDAR